MFGLVELWVVRLAGVAGIGALGWAAAAVFSALRRAPGREEPLARIVLRSPAAAALTILWLVAGVLLWRPIPFGLSTALHLAALLVGLPVYTAGLGLYFWGMRALGPLFGPSSALAVRLSPRHRLVTTGPYAHIRHPMYLGVILAGLGALLLFRTWAALLFCLTAFSLGRRAGREDRVLAQEFGQEWEAYSSRVPAWLPRVLWGSPG